jgi:hypothetical protein
MSVSARNRILPLVVFAIAAITSGFYMSLNSTMSWASVTWFLALLSSLVLVGQVIVERKLHGHYGDPEVLGLAIAGMVFVAVMMFGYAYLGSVKDLGIIFMALAALGRWVIVGTKPSGAYRRYVEFLDRRYQRKIARKQQYVGLDLLAAHSDNHEPQPA